MSGLLAIQSVGGTSPDYTLTVTSSVGVMSGDYVVAPKLSDPTRGAIYRVTSVPDGSTILVTDDLVPGGGTYGAPTLGRSAYWTPTANGVSTDKVNGTPFWGDVTERDLLLLEGGVDSSEKHGKLIPGDFSGNPKKATVTFAEAYPSDGYAITLSVITDGTKSFVAQVESKTAGGFVVNLHANNIANFVELDWSAEVIGE